MAFRFKMVSNMQWKAFVIALIFLIISGCSGKNNPAIPDSRSADPIINGAGSNSATLSSSDNLSGSSQVPISTQADRWAEDEVLVVLNDDITPSQATEIFSKNKLNNLQTIACRWGTVFELRITDGTPVPDMVKILQSDPSVQIAEPNLIYTFDEAFYFPNDPLWEGPDEGDDPRDSVYEQWGPAMLGASLVWNESKGSSDVVVAIIDTGVRKTHVDLAGALWNNADEIPGNGIDDDGNGKIDDTWGWDFVSNDNDPNDDGYYASYHGSACAGIVAAVQDNFKGVSGIAPGVKIMALKVDLSGGGPIYESSVVGALEYARVNEADICSMSFGTWDYSTIMENQCNSCWNDGDGVILMASAGNEDSTTIRYPSLYQSVMTIGATIPFDESHNPIDEARISWYSGWYWGSCYGPSLDVMGFGELYLTTHGEGDNTYWDGGSNGFFAGTSCACPVTAGVMALIKSFNPDKNGQWCWDRLVQTADDIGAPGFDDQTGNGRVNALRAVYGSDRYESLEDGNGFVPVSAPDTPIYDSIHDVPGNPYLDTTDLYRFTAPSTGTWQFNLDIFTYGENLDIAVYSDLAMTNLVGQGIVVNHAGTSFEEVILAAYSGLTYYIKVYSPAVGNSSTYGINIHKIVNDLSVTGESLAPSFTNVESVNVPVLKLILSITSAATLDEVIINKSGTMPNDSWTLARLYRDANGNGELDGGDTLLIQKNPMGLNRVRLSDLGIAWNYHNPLVLFFAADISGAPEDTNVTFSLQTYKDIATVQKIAAPYDQFPISSDSLYVGIDDEAPVWESTVGAQTATSYYKSVKIEWNKAIDVFTPPVKYNVYYTQTLPFDFGTATKLANVTPQTGSAADYRYTVPNLLNDQPYYLAVRAEDQTGNEDTNIIVVSATPTSHGDPAAPVIINEYSALDPQAVAITDTLLVVADFGGLKVYDRTNPVDPPQVGTWNYGGSMPYVYSLICEGNYAYCGGYDKFSVVNLSNPASPSTADFVNFDDGRAIAKKNNWVYLAGSFSNALVPINVTDPYNITAGAEVSLDFLGNAYHMAFINNYLYLTRYNEGIEVLGLANPAAPVELGHFATGHTHAIIADGTNLFVKAYEGALTSWDASSTPQTPTLLDSSTDGPGTGAQGIVLIGDYAYVTEPDWGLVTFDISDPSNIQYVGGVQKLGIAHLATDGTLIYAVGYDNVALEGFLLVII
ncbi:MAG: S8 family serine peptidase [bacterium]|nr:S8 family serine peptidase [bacterium]